MVRSMDDDDDDDAMRAMRAIFFGFFTHSAPVWLRRRRACREREIRLHTRVDELDCVGVTRD